MSLLPAARPAESAEAPYDVNVLVSLTGQGAFIGRGIKDSLSALQEFENSRGGINGRPIRFLFHNDESSPQTSLSLANQIVASKPAVMLGPNLVANCSAIAVLLTTRPVDYCLTPSVHPPDGSYMFSVSVATRDYMQSLVRYFRERGWKRVAIITGTDAGGQDGDVTMAAVMGLPEYKDAGMQLVAREYFNPADFTVAAQMTRIKAQDPQVVVCYSTGTAFGTLLKGVQQAGINTPIATGSGNMSYAQMNQYKPMLPSELYFVPGAPFLGGAAPSAKAKTAQQAFLSSLQRSGVMADYLAAVPWDAAEIIIDALRRAGPNATADQVHRSIEELHGFTGIFGDYDFRGGNQRGLNASSIIVSRWDPGKQIWAPVSKPGGVPLPQ